MQFNLVNHHKLSSQAVHKLTCSSQAVHKLSSQAVHKQSSQGLTSLAVKQFIT